MNVCYNRLCVKLKCLIIINIVIFFFSSRSAAQKQQIEFDHISVEQGLFQVSVYCMLQDQRGVMWFGTGEGLNKYDGYTFTIYKHEPGNPNSLSSNAIRAMHEDQEGIFWIGTTWRGGLNTLIS
jgi:ligand-binding sensor domain-containing protein